MEETQEAMNPQNFQTPKKDELKLETKRKNSSSSPAVGTRLTRSRIAPDWTTQEQLILVRETTAIDSTFLRALPSIQKWKMISDNCTASGVVRSSDQCHRRWESILADIKKIKDWETRPGVVSYWSLENEKKMELGLPSSFDEELFRAIDYNLKAPGYQSGTDPDSESEAEVEMQNAVADSQKMLIPIEDSQKIITPIADSQEMLTPIVNSVLKRKKGTQSREKSREKGRVGRPKSKIIEMAAKTRENIELIHTILNGDNEKKDIALNELRNPGMLQMELARRQGNNLIEVLGSLVEKLNQLYDLVEERG